MSDDSKFMGCVAAGIILLVLAVSAGYALKYFTAEIRGEIDANERIVANGANRIAQYDYFFSLCSGAQAAEDNIDVATAALEDATDLSQQEKENYRRLISGNHAQRQANIREYNSRATRDYTSARFHDSDLPWQLNAAPYVPGGSKTVCASQ